MTQQQRIARILTTRIGERVGMPTYGSNLYLLRDKPLNTNTRIMFAKYCKDAIELWEDVQITKAEILQHNAVSGVFTFRLTLLDGSVLEGVA